MTRPAVRAAVGLVLLLAAASTPFAQDVERRKGFSIRITYPANQEVIFGKVKITAEVEAPDPAEIDRVEFLVGDKVIFVDRQAPWECFHDFGEESKSWVIRAVAYHREGISVSDVVITRKMSFGAFEKVNRVILWVSVTDKQDRFVTGLDKDSFRVFEDGRQQQIIDFYPEDRPITLAIVLDTSGSMLDNMDDVHAAARSFVDTLRPEDQALVIDFDDRVFLIQDRTPDKDALTEAVTSTEALGATALYDALHAAYRKLRGIEGRKAIILLSDGDDTSSQFSYKRVLEEAKANETIIYAIGLGTGVAKDVLREFAENTGGRAFFVKKAAELTGVYQRIAEELRRQYYLTYSTGIDTWDGHWVKIRVENTDSNLAVRARRGFFAVKPEGAQPAPAAAR